MFCIPSRVYKVSSTDGTTSSTTTTAPSFSSPTCSDVLSKADLVIVHDGKGKITSVEADVYLVDVDNTDTFTGEAGSVQQSFSVK